MGIGCPALQDAVNKYGIDKFTFKILLICFDEDRYKFEIEYIIKFNLTFSNLKNKIIYIYFIVYYQLLLINTKIRTSIFQIYQKYSLFYYFFQSIKY